VKIYDCSFTLTSSGKSLRQIGQVKSEAILERAWVLIAEKRVDLEDADCEQLVASIVLFIDNEMSKGWSMSCSDSFPFGPCRPYTSRTHVSFSLVPPTWQNRDRCLHTEKEIKVMVLVLLLINQKLPVLILRR
jgi:hypothetical protein